MEPSPLRVLKSRPKVILFIKERKKIEIGLIELIKELNYKLVI